MGDIANSRGSRLDPKTLAQNFCEDVHPPLNLHQAKIEALRCYFCYDAPCIAACPTRINIPSFIQKIATGNLRGSAIDILSENIFGGICARVCPVEVLCEGSCVRTKAEGKPVAIGLLQRYATDYLFERKIKPFRRPATTGRKIAVVGAGPAGLACAHRLALYGHEIVVFEAKEKAGGLNEYGLAPYKVVGDFAQKEVKFIEGVGGIEIRLNEGLGEKLKLRELREKFDAVFLAVGLSGVNALQLDGEQISGVFDAVHFIEKIRQTGDLSKLSVGKNVIVIGGGSTAIDAAVATKRLGAEKVTLVYRRGEASMKATEKEREFAKQNGVILHPWARPKKIYRDDSGVKAVEFETTKLNSHGELIASSEYFAMECDMLFKAIGQVLVPQSLGDTKEVLEISDGRIVVDEKYRTTLKKVYAGGDCTNGGELTVVSVQDGKLAAESIHRDLGV